MKIFNLITTIFNQVINDENLIMLPVFLLSAFMFSIIDDILGTIKGTLKEGFDIKVFLIGKAKRIDKSKAFIVYSGCDLETTALVRENVARRIEFDKLYETQASATVSSNCGPSTFGVLYVRKD